MRVGIVIPRGLPSVVVLAMAAALSPSLSACVEPRQITVEITTDVPCGDLRGTTVTIGELTGIDARPITAQTSACNEARIGSLVVVPSAEDTDVVAIRVASGVKKDVAECTPGKSGCIVARRALRYVAHKSLFLPIT